MLNNYDIAEPTARSGFCNRFNVHNKYFSVKHVHLTLFLYVRPSILIVVLVVYK